jgi:hypothetical protein
MKKFIAFLFAAAMVLTVACKGKDAPAPVVDPTPDTVAPVTDATNK